MSEIGRSNDGGLERLAVPIWVADDGNVAPMNAEARRWLDEPGWPALGRLIRALLRVPGHATGSYESGGRIYQILTIDGEDGPLVLMRPIRPGESEGEVERRLAEIVHDLNAPITSLRLRLGNLRQERSDDERLRGELLAADRELGRLQAIVRDAASLGRLSAHILQPVETSAAALLESVTASLSPLAHSRNVRLEARPVHGEMRVDRPWVERALMNLVENAIRHSPTGEAVTIEAVGRHGEWQIRVRDRGRGISPEALSGAEGHHDPVGTRTLPGGERNPSGARGLAGLGLTLVRRIAAAHGGSLEVLSEEGLGSTFTLVLPGTFPPSPSISEPRHPK